MEHRSTAPPNEEGRVKHILFALGYVLLAIAIAFFVAPYRGWRNRKEERVSQYVHDPDDEEEGRDERWIGYIAIFLIWAVFQLVHLFDWHKQNCTCGSCLAETHK